MKQYIDRETVINELNKPIPEYLRDNGVHYRSILQHKIEEIEKLPVVEETCECLKTTYQDEYWGYWIKCECGSSSPEYSNYCSGCGKKIKIVGSKDYSFGLEDD